MHTGRLSDNTILIVDDVPENLYVPGESLRGVGYGVRVANSVHSDRGAA